MKRFLLVLVLLALPFVANGENVTGRKMRLRVPSTGDIIDNVAMNATDPSFTWTNPSNVLGWDYMNIYVSITDANNTVTNLVATCYASEDGATTVYQLNACYDVSIGTHLCKKETWTVDNDATPIQPNILQDASPKRWFIGPIDISNIGDIKCVFSDTGGEAADKWDIYYVLGVR